MVTVFKPKHNIPIFWVEWLAWQWFIDKLIMVSVRFTESQLPPTVRKQSYKVKVTKRNVYLSDDNLANDEENITEPKRNRKQKLITAIPSPESNDPSITKLIGLIVLVKKDIDKFCEGDN